MKVLVSGANGLLGSYIVRELIHTGYQVCAFVRKGCNLELLSGIDIEIMEGNITNREDVENAVKGCDYVIHSAASTLQATSLSFFWEANINSTRYFIDACKNYHISRFVYVSTANCFGNGPRSNPGNEKIPFMPWLRESGYAYSKYIAQQMVLNETNKNGFNPVVVNPTFIFGSGDIVRSSGKIFSYVLNRKVVFYPPGGKNFVSAPIVAKGIIQALKYGKAGESYLLAGENLSYREFFQIVNNTTGNYPLMIKLPKLLLMFFGTLGSLVEMLVNKPVALTRANAKMLCAENYYDPFKAVSEIGYKLASIETEIKKLIAGIG
ncbi:MAG: NAD-dependent epimerase/dehydratase family protein [Prolixibacteraceae bacterium]|nr:NAD-dependent epimerase/dehydratase family protein [Prolixibacteraceae bacterium]